MTTAAQSASPCITAALRAASRRMTMLYDEIMAPSGLRATQYYILSELERSTRQSSTVGELSNILTMERSALGQTLRPLERDGFIAFGRDARDGRRRPILLTPLGRKAVARARPYWAQAHERFMRFYGTDRTAELRSALRAIAEDPELSGAFDSDALLGQPLSR